MQPFPPFVAPIANFSFRVFSIVFRIIVTPFWNFNVTLVNNVAGFLNHGTNLFFTEPISHHSLCNFFTIHHVKIVTTICITSSPDAYPPSVISNISRTGIVTIVSNKHVITVSHSIIVNSLIVFFLLPKLMRLYFNVEIIAEQLSDTINNIGIAIKEPSYTCGSTNQSFMIHL